MNNDNEEIITNPRNTENVDSFAILCERRYSRRTMLKGGLAVGATSVLAGLSGCGSDDDETSGAAGESPFFDFTEIEHGMDEHHHVAPEYETQVLLRWGDALFADSPEFDIHRQTAESQLKQFGYNTDYIGYLPLKPKWGEDERALLCINHEYSLPGLMFPYFKEETNQCTREEQAAVAMASIGNTIVEVTLEDGEWSVKLDSKYNRRISLLETEMQLTGPAAGLARMATTADRQATKVIGTMNNCAGGMTPWGTYLTCEENIDYQFSGTLPENHPETENYQRMSIPFRGLPWGDFDPRFDLSKEPNEANRFGWVVEIDPLDPTSTPKKRTALGRFKHEGAENIIAPDGRLVVYMGDDQRFEYLYKFVSRDKVDLKNRTANADLLDNGTLYCAKFDDEGGLQWLPLVYSNPTLSNAFRSQGDILIDARRAADLLGATPMDRPEDVVPNPKTGKVYVIMTNNSKRKKGNAANPRKYNMYGHIIELTEDNNDHTGTSGRWDFLIKAGDPDKGSVDAMWNKNTTKNGWFASPDNGVVDPSGRLWVTSDQGENVHLTGTNDGLWGVETEGAGRGTGKMFFRVPNGAEMSGPIFSENGENLFLSVQHPGDAEPLKMTTFKTASTRWPDFDEDLPPRPSVVVVRRKGGGRIG